MIHRVSEEERSMAALIDHFDHFVVPVDDLLAAESFYMDVLGGRVALNAHGGPMRLGLNVQAFMAGSRPHTFFVIAGKRIGAYLQCEVRPKAQSVHGGPTYSFVTSPRGLDRLAGALRERDHPFEGPVDDDGVPAVRSLFFNDPAGNHYHVYVPAEPRNAATDDALAGVGYLRLEAPNLEASIRFYTETFGLEVQAIGRNERLDAREATLRMPSGQLLFLIEVPFSAKGIKLGWNIPGPHLAFFVPGVRWDTLYGRLAELGIANGDVLPEMKGRKPGELDTYLSDPAGYRLQLVGEGIE
jgi:catechol 2,3-dioxygenase-like lactoylglutathione lyase family enzyme